MRTYNRVPSFLIIALLGAGCVFSGDVEDTRDRSRFEALRAEFSAGDRSWSLLSQLAGLAASADNADRVVDALKAEHELHPGDAKVAHFYFLALIRSGRYELALKATDLVLGAVCGRGELDRCDSTTLAILEADAVVRKAQLAQAAAGAKRPLSGIPSAERLLQDAITKADAIESSRGLGEEYERLVGIHPALAARSVYIDQLRSDGRPEESLRVIEEWFYLCPRYTSRRVCHEFWKGTISDLGDNWSELNPEKVRLAPEVFDSETWKSGDSSIRKTMVGDLIESRMLFKRKRSAVVALLGQPEQEGDDYLVYDLSFDWQAPGPFLELFLDDDVVREAMVVQVVED